MPAIRLDATADLPGWAPWVALALAVFSLVFLVVEIQRSHRDRWAITATGVLSVVALFAAVLRPARVASLENRVGARVVVLADTSRSMALPDEQHRMRRQARDQAIAALRSLGGTVRLSVFGFGDGSPTPWSDAASSDASAGAPRSDLASALRALATSLDERPSAIVVVSDGRLDDPSDTASEASLRSFGEALHAPIHTVATTDASPPDASIRRVTSSAAAVAHVPLPLRIDVGCAGGLVCDDLAVSARELRDDGAPVLLGSGVAHLKDGLASLDMSITLEQAGYHVVEIAVAAPSGDVIPENDRRLVTFQVARERVRVLHVAGRPTDDVRALRQWLKGDPAIDLVSFFILRTPTDDAHAGPNELSLIPFPVDDLFTKYLSTFDAVVLQDFDAQPYGLERYLGNIHSYVRAGGGLVMVGGENSFVAGGYAGTALADLLPIELDASPGASSADTSPFVPQWTAEGRVAPMLGPLRDVVGDELPEMPGANIVGDARAQGIVLLSHPTRTTRSGAKMPVLAIGEQGGGRTIALGIDGAWRLQFSDLAARTGGRGHGALWNGLLGWLMRDPRFEIAQMNLRRGCTAGVPAMMDVHLLPGVVTSSRQLVSLEIKRIDLTEPSVLMQTERSSDTTTVRIELPALASGAYSALVTVPGLPPTRLDFACEAGGDEWADSRPDPERLRTLARATGGTFVTANDAATLPMPKPAVVSRQRKVTAVAPPWAWSVAAAVLLGTHWIARRRAGLS
jgi:uncharacterized membrane protein